MSKSYDQAELRFYTALGQFLERFYLSHPATSSLPFDLALNYFAMGLYVYILTVENQTIQGKFVKW
ncbi:MAG: hypothetical protein AB8H47_12380 [Bacteroidia bacterium]